jgi:hypothetical protein
MPINSRTSNDRTNTVILTWKSADRSPSLREYPGICLTTEEKARKNLSQGGEKPQSGSAKLHEIITDFTSNTKEYFYMN